VSFASREHLTTSRERENVQVKNWNGIDPMPYSEVEITLGGVQVQTRRKSGAKERGLRRSEGNSNNNETGYATS